MWHVKLRVFHASESIPSISFAQNTPWVKISHRNHGKCDEVSTFGQVSMAVFRPRNVFYAKLMLGVDSEAWKNPSLTCHMCFLKNYYILNYYIIWDVMGKYFLGKNKKCKPLFSCSIGFIEQKKHGLQKSSRNIQ